MLALRPLRTLALIAGLLVLASCAAEVPTGPESAPVSGPAQDFVGQDNHLLGGVLGGVLLCKPQPYASATQVIGAAGGTIKVGRHTLVVPAGALDAPVQIKAEAPSDAVSSLRFSPEGLQFKPGHSPVLTLDYSNCPAGRLNILKRIAYTTERLQIITRLLSLDNLVKMQISAPIEHFSRYAVAW